MTERETFLSERSLSSESKSSKTMGEFTFNKLKSFVQFCSVPQLSELQKVIEDSLKFDIVSALYKKKRFTLLKKIYSYVSPADLMNVERASKQWYYSVVHTLTWNAVLLAHIDANDILGQLGVQRGWHGYVTQVDRLLANFKVPDFETLSSYYRGLYFAALKDLTLLNFRWRSGQYVTRQLQCDTERTKGVYCVQYDEHILVCGLRDNTVKIFDFKTFRLLGHLVGHSGSVLCLQYEGQMLITGSSDSTVRMWDMKQKSVLVVAKEHIFAVLHLKFVGDTLATCSKDTSVLIWAIEFRLIDKENNYVGKLTKMKKLTGHNGAINVVDFDCNMLLSASGDRTIRVYESNEFTHSFTLTGHTRGIASLHYNYPLVVTGSSDNTIRLWNLLSRNCIAIIDGGEELVRCVRMDAVRIIAGSYDGQIRIWHFKNILNRKDLSMLRGYGVGLAKKDTFVDNFKLFSLDKDNEAVLADKGLLRDCAALNVKSADRIQHNLLRLNGEKYKSDGHDDEGEENDREETLRQLNQDASKFIVQFPYDANKLRIISEMSYKRLVSLVKHTSRVFKVQMDNFRVVSSSHDDNVICWEFLEPRLADRELWTIDAYKQLSGALHGAVNAAVERELVDFNFNMKMG